MKKIIMVASLIFAAFVYVHFNHELSVPVAIICIGIAACMSYADYEKAERRRVFKERMKRIRKEEKEVA